MKKPQDVKQSSPSDTTAVNIVNSIGATKRLSIRVSSDSGTVTASITRKPNSPMLYLDTRYNFKRLELSLNLKDTPENQIDAIVIVKKIVNQIYSGTFSFQAAFPHASAEAKAYHAQFEKRNTPDCLTINQHVLGFDNVEGWLSEIVNKFGITKRNDYCGKLRCHILPYFGDMTFEQVNGETIQKFVLSLTTGRTDGPSLSGASIRNILTVLKAIFHSVNENYKWQLNPFIYEKLQRAIPSKTGNPPLVMRIKDWKKLINALPEFYRPIVKFMVLTGLNASELQGLRKCDITDNELRIRNKRTALEEVESLKTIFRQRDIPITEAIRECLDILLARTDEDQPYVLVMEDCSIYDHSWFRENVWRPAFEKAKLPYVKPSVTRHTFAAWSICIHVNIHKLQGLMGHGSKKMLYEVYGNKCQKGIGDDADEILLYMGADFVGGSKALKQRVAPQLQVNITDLSGQCHISTDYSRVTNSSSFSSPPNAANYYAGSSTCSPLQLRRHDTDAPTYQIEKVFPLHTAQMIPPDNNFLGTQQAFGL